MGACCMDVAWPLGVAGLGGTRLSCHLGKKSHLADVGSTGHGESAPYGHMDVPSWNYGAD